MQQSAKKPEEIHENVVLSQLAGRGEGGQRAQDGDVDEHDEETSLIAGAEDVHVDQLNDPGQHAGQELQVDPQPLVNPDQLVDTGPPADQRPLGDHAPHVDLDLQHNSQRPPLNPVLPAILDPPAKPIQPVPAKPLLRNPVEVHDDGGILDEGGEGDADPAVNHRPTDPHATAGGNGGKTTADNCC